MAYLVSKGTSININFKVGLFSVRNGYMNFKQFNADGTTYGKDQQLIGEGTPLRSNTFDAMSARESLSYDKYSMIGSLKAQDLSVRTPSVGGATLGGQTIGGTTATSSAYVHASNPNPQKGKYKFKSIRDQGYATPTHGAGNATSRAGLTLIHSPYVEGKFGKRVYMGNYHMSDKEVFDLHMQQIKMKGDLHTFDRAIKIKEEQEFSKFVHDQLKKDHAKQEHIQRLMKADFVEENLIKRLNNIDKKKQEESAKKSERYDHFPFRGSDTIEKFREELKQMQRKQFLEYINSDEYKKSMQTSTNFNATRSTVSPLTDQLSATLTARNPGLLDDTSIPAGDVTGRGIKMINCI